MSDWNVVTLGLVIHFDNRSWRVERYCEEPATGIAVLRECGRGTLTLAIPVGLLADLITSRAEVARLQRESAEALIDKLLFDTSGENDKHFGRHPWETPIQAKTRMLHAFAGEVPE